MFPSRGLFPFSPKCPPVRSQPRVPTKCLSTRSSCYVWFFYSVSISRVTIPQVTLCSLWKFLLSFQNLSLLVSPLRCLPHFSSPPNVEAWGSAWRFPVHTRCPDGLIGAVAPCPRGLLGLLWRGLEARGLKPRCELVHMPICDSRGTFPGLFSVWELLPILGALWLVASSPQPLPHKVTWPSAFCVSVWLRVSVSLSPSSYKDSIHWV